MRKRNHGQQVSQPENDEPFPGSGQEERLLVEDKGCSPTLLAGCRDHPSLGILTRRSFDDGKKVVIDQGSGGLFGAFPSHHL